MTRYTAIALAILGAGCANAADKTVDRSFTVAPGGTLIVDADSATVEVSGNNTNQVTVRMTASGSDEDLAAMKLDAVQNGNEVTVTMKRTEKHGWFSWSWHGDARIRVTVPQRFAVSVQTGGGNVQLADTSGTASLRTSGGDIAARNVSGNVEAKTSGGGIHVDTLKGDIDADTSGGDVQLMKVDGKISGKTSGGDVECSLVGVNRGIKLATSGGSIRLTLPATTTANFEAKTSGGEFTSQLPVTTTMNGDGHAKGSINGGGQEIDARTSGGDIAFRLAN